MNQVVARTLVEKVPITNTAVGTTESTDLVCAGKNQWYHVLLIQYTRSAGDGATYQLRLGESDGWTNDDLVYERLTLSSTTNTTPTLHAPTNCYIKSDANSKIYFKPCFASGVNNTGSGFLLLEPMTKVPGDD